MREESIFNKDKTYDKGTKKKGTGRELKEIQ